MLSSTASDRTHTARNGCFGMPSVIKTLALSSAMIMTVTCHQAFAATADSTRQYPPATLPDNGGRLGILFDTTAYTYQGISVVKVLDVYPASSLYGSLHPGDFIYGVNGFNLRGGSDLYTIVASGAPGSTETVWYFDAQHNYRAMQITATVKSDSAFPQAQDSATSSKQVAGNADSNSQLAHSDKRADSSRLDQQTQPRHSNRSATSESTSKLKNSDARQCLEEDGSFRKVYTGQMTTFGPTYDTVYDRILTNICNYSITVEIISGTVFITHTEVALPPNNTYTDSDYQVGKVRRTNQ